MRQFDSRVLAIIGICGVLVPQAFGATITQTYSGGFPATITGTLPNQGTALLENFTLSSMTNLTITTTSYASGGFEPNLLLFNSAGKFVMSGNPFGTADPSTGIVGDMKLTESGLAAGAYTLAVTDFLLNQSLTATNLSDGFTVNYGSGTTFVDANGNSRTGNFALTISTGASAVPEPATFWLVAPFLGVLAVIAGRRRFSRRTPGSVA
jgi:hypothetical protein